MRTVIINISSGDKYRKICENIVWSKGQRILLVWMKQTKIQKPLYFFLMVLRCVKKIGGQLALVTDNLEIMEIAEKNSVPIFHSVDEAEAKPWLKHGRKAIRYKGAKSNNKNRAPIVRRSNNLFTSWMPLGLRVFVFLLGVISFLVLILIFVPRAEVVLSLTTETKDMEIDVFTNDSIPGVQMSGGIPSELVTVTINGNSYTNSTGSTLTPLEYAMGIIEVRNVTESALVLDQGIMISTSGEDPVYFSTTEKVDVDSSDNVVNVPIIAIKPGSNGNVDKDQIQTVIGEQGQNIVITNPEPTYGGTDQFALSPSLEDYTRLKNELISQLSDQAEIEISNNLESDEKLIPNSTRVINIIEENAVPEIGQASDRIDIQMQIEFGARIYHEDDLNALIEQTFNMNLSKRYVVSDISLPTYFEGDATFKDENIRWQVTAIYNIHEKIDAEILKTEITGLSKKKAYYFLQDNLHLNSDPEIVLTPKWWPVLPLLPEQINIIIK